MKIMNRRLRMLYEEKLRRDDLTAVSRQQPWMSLRDLLDAPYPIGNGQYYDPRRKRKLNASKKEDEAAR